MGGFSCQCPACEDWFLTSRGLRDHYRAKHQDTPPLPQAIPSGPASGWRDDHRKLIALFPKGEYWRAMFADNSEMRIPAHSEAFGEYASRWAMLGPATSMPDEVWEEIKALPRRYRR